MPGSDTPSALLVDFANTLDIDGDVTTELIGTPDELGRWLAEHGLLPVRAVVTGDDVLTAHALRDGLRAVMASHHDGATTPAAALGPLESAAGELSLRVAFSGGRPHLVPMGEDVTRALGAILVAVEEAAAEGTWPRLKLCQASTCQVAFHDTSKNQSRQWCSMRVCGNRQKTRAYRRRQQASA
jgi:predicted RNA-binding Zn ribbon-like protein